MDGKTRYYLIACGTSEYQNLDENQQLVSVKTDIERVVDLFTEYFGYKQVLTNLQLNPSASALKEQFADWLRDQERRETDQVIFYYSGHGDYYNHDRHYLWMKDTDPNKIPQTSLPTEDLVRPLNNDGVKIAQILYIIDTCYSGSGTSNITKFASGVIQNYQPVRGANIAVHAIAACRAKDTAQENVFSNALRMAIQGLNRNQDDGYIHPEKIVNHINQITRQLASYKNAGSETLAKFFPIFPQTLRTWEENRSDFIQSLLEILIAKLESSLFFINSFLLSRDFIEEFVLDQQDIKEKLNNLSLKPVVDGICPLIVCSEWCRNRFREPSNFRDINVAEKLENWQNQVIKYRVEVKLNKIREAAKSYYDMFKIKIQKEKLRIQIEIEPEIDAKEGTGKPTGAFLLHMNLWIESQKLPFGRFAENKVLQLQTNDSLRMCLEKEDFLSGLIRKARYGLLEPIKPDIDIDIDIEIFMPLVFYQESLEKICFQFGNTRKELGKEYRIFINSFERYFDEDFREIRDKVYRAKKALWCNENIQSSEIYYIGTKPSQADLEMIEETKAIAVWSRNNQKPLQEVDLNMLEWKNWPNKIYNLRQENQDLEITLFWDDLYPKPSRSSRPLNTKVVD